MEDSIFPFAMVLDVTPAEKAHFLADAVRKARCEPGMMVDVRTPALYFFTVTAAVEFLAIDQAEQWLHRLASEHRLTLNLNAQPDFEC